MFSIINCTFPLLCMSNIIINTLFANVIIARLCGNIKMYYTSMPTLVYMCVSRYIQYLDRRDLCSVIIIMIILLLLHLRIKIHCRLCQITAKRMRSYFVSTITVKGKSVPRCLSSLYAICNIALVCNLLETYFNLYFCDGRFSVVNHFVLEQWQFFWMTFDTFENT